MGVFFKFFAPLLFNFKLTRTEETVLGTVLPLMILAFYEIWAWHLNKTSSYYEIFEETREQNQREQIPQLQQNLADKQNAYGIKVIAASMAVTGGGILMLSLFADKGAGIAATVAVCILASAYPLWKVSTRPGNNPIKESNPFTKIKVR
jgi:hypothetical protein